MPMYYYVSVPVLPDVVRHQSNSVEILTYLVQEGESVRAGMPLVRVRNWWAVMELDAVGSGRLLKAFFMPRTNVQIGNPVAIIDCVDLEDAPRGTETCHLRIVKTVRHRPGRE